ncbi:MAG: menaquinol-cytochrome C reductase, partial [Jatrophihabitans sp.]
MTHGSSEGPSADELRAMSPEEAMRAGAAADGVHILARASRHPVAGARAEKKLERRVALCFAIAALGGLGFIVCFIALPYDWHLPGTPQTFR